MKVSVKILKWLTGISHALFAFYIFQGDFYLSWMPLLSILTLHVITILLAKKAAMETYANLLGIITTLVAFYDSIAVVMHIIAAIFIILDAANINIKKTYEL
ncbi:hypothetical protein COI93_23995 [Bacillus cereus]|uniref:Group-specific protein n=1 Tax=Bacillus cereus TaxID=1396 RepID=A0A2B0LI98_BACCE|nr:hypothetical protein COI93_23995 [Bacillus cereus]